MIFIKHSLIIDTFVNTINYPICVYCMLYLLLASLYLSYSCIIFHVDIVICWTVFKCKIHIILFHFSLLLLGTVESKS